MNELVGWPSMVEGGRLLTCYTGLNLYRGFKSLPHRQLGNERIKVLSKAIMSQAIKKLIFIFLLAFALNLIWENLHSVLYFLPSGGRITEIMLLWATFIDALLVVIISLLFLLWPWFSRKIWLVIPIGIFISIIIELRALSAGHWAYAEIMPIIPLLNTGLTPTIQLGLIAYVIYKPVRISR